MNKVKKVVKIYLLKQYMEIINNMLIKMKKKIVNLKKRKIIKTMTQKS